MVWPTDQPRAISIASQSINTNLMRCWLACHVSEARLRVCLSSRALARSRTCCVLTIVPARRGLYREREMSNRNGARRGTLFRYRTVMKKRGRA